MQQKHTKGQLKKLTLESVKAKLGQLEEKVPWESGNAGETRRRRSGNRFAHQCIPDLSPRHGHRGCGDGGDVADDRIVELGVLTQASISARRHSAVILAPVVRVRDALEGYCSKRSTLFSKVPGTATATR